MSKADFDFESRLVPLMVAFARDRGVDVKALAARHRLPDEVLQPTAAKGTLVTPSSTLPAIAAELSEHFKDPHVGVTMAEWVPKGTYGVAEFLMRSGPTIRQSYESLVRFNGIIAPNQTFRLDFTETEAELHNAAHVRQGVLGRHLHEFGLAIMVRTLATFSPNGKPRRVWFANPREASVDMARLASFFSTNDLQFDAADSGYSVALSLLEEPVQGGDAALYSFLEEHAVAALASRPRSDDLVDKLRHLIRDALKQGEPNVERVATRLNMSGRTLQRRLSDLKTSFQEVLDLVRFDLARQYLKDVRLDVSQVAYLLGYSELRAFDRAFRRWADKSPSEWRSAAT